MLAAFERHERALVANDATLDVRLRADAVRPAHLAGVIGEHKENIHAGKRMSVWTGGDFHSRLSKLEAKQPNPGGWQKVPLASANK